MFREFVAIIVIAASVSTAVRASGERVLVAFGTSLTDRGSWPAELVQILEPCFPEGLRLERVAGVGKGSEWGLDAVNSVIVAQPDFVLFEFAINDADLLDGVGVNDSRSNHLAIIKLLRSALPGVRIAIVTTNPAFGPRGWMRPRLAEYYEMYREIAALENDVTLIDLFPLWRQVLADSSDRLLPDGLHPTNKAVREIALPALKAGVLGMLPRQDLLRAQRSSPDQCSVSLDSSRRAMPHAIADD